MNMKKFFRALACVLALAMLACGALADMAKGDRSSAVAAVQQRLIELGYLDDVADGIFGKNTENAVIAFQLAFGLPATGIVDNATLLQLSATGSTPTPIPANEAPTPIAETPTPVPATPAPTPTAEAPAGVQVFSSEGDVFASLKLMDGCGWVSDEESASYGLGRNSAGEEIIYGISLVNDGAPDDMLLEAVSWMEDAPFDSTDMMECWTEAKAGRTAACVSRHTEINSQGSVYPVATVDIFLPDDPAIAGEQTVTVSLSGHIATARVKLTYDGGYGDGHGWKLEPLGITLGDGDQ